MKSQGGGVALNRMGKLAPLGKYKKGSKATKGGKVVLNAEKEKMRTTWENVKESIRARRGSRGGKTTPRSDR